MRPHHHVMETDYVVAPDGDPWLVRVIHIAGPPSTQGTNAPPPCGQGN